MELVRERVSAVGGWSFCPVCRLRGGLLLVRRVFASEAAVLEEESCRCAECSWRSEPVLVWERPAVRVPEREAVLV